jgi:hypothetical protein
VDGGKRMSCYLRHLDPVLKQAGIKVDADNRKQVDQAIHRVVGVHYKDCPPTWKEVKRMIAEDEGAFVQRLKEEMAKA